jgi:hypothetical protein
MKRKLVIGVALVLLAFSALAVIRWIVWAPARHLENTARVMIGRPETDLIRKLGEPQHVVLSATLAGRTVDYPWRGMNFVPVPRHPVRNKVLLYSKMNFALYVYVNERGIIEHVAAAWT